MEKVFFPNYISRNETINRVIRNTHNNFKVYLFLNAFFGFAFSPFSQGFAVYLFFYVLWELNYAYSIRCEYDTQITGERLVLVLAGISGFMFGRILLKKDYAPYRIRYTDRNSYHNLWSIFTGMGGNEA